MALAFTFVSMLLTSASDLFEKKSVSSRIDEVMKTLVWYGIFNALLVCAVMFLVVDEISLMPHEVIMETPAIALASLFNYSCLFFALAAYKYVGVSVRNSFINTDGIFFVILIVGYHVLTGKAAYVTRLFEPAAIIGLILVIAAAIIYPHFGSGQEQKDDRQESEQAGTPKKILIIGIAIAMVSAFFDGAESMVTSVMIGDEVVDSYDYICATGTLQVIISILLWICLWIRDKKAYNPFGKTEKYRLGGQLCGLLSDLFYVFALSDDALLGVILWNAFPILDIIGARLIMKEKLNYQQYVILFMLILGAVLVSLS